MDCIPEALSSKHKDRSSGEQNGSQKQTRKAKNTMISQSCVKKKKSVHSLFLLQLQMRKNVKGFKSESLPNESKNLGCVVKLHTVEASAGGSGKNSTFEPTPWEFAQEWVVLITHSANQVQEWAFKNLSTSGGGGGGRN